MVPAVNLGLLLLLLLLAPNPTASSPPPAWKSDDAPADLVAWSGPRTTPGVTGPGTASVIVDGESMPAHWFTGGPFNQYTGAPSRSPPALADAALVNWISTVQAASANGVRIFEPLLNQWQLDNSTADGISDATSTLLDSTLRVRSDAFFVLRIHICPDVHHMYREGRNADDPLPPRRLAAAGGAAAGASPPPAAWQVLNDTDFRGAFAYSQQPAAGIEECARQCLARPNCVATAWNGPASQFHNRLCNFVSNAPMLVSPAHPPTQPVSPTRRVGGATSSSGVRPS